MELTPIQKMIVVARQQILLYKATHKKKLKEDKKMINLERIENEIAELNIQLWRKKNEYKKAKESNLKEQYGDNFGCSNCAYGCCVNVDNICTDCVKGNCVHCNKRCNEYIPENELSKYIKEYHYFEQDTVDLLNDFFEVSDIMKCPELHQKALDVLKSRDEGEIK